MSTTEIALIAAALALVAVLLVARRSGPHVTTIETRREDEDGDGKS